jgi:hypothetical protein
LRGQVRARVKAHPGWKAFLDHKGILSASARNADLIEFALQQPQLATQIKQTLQNYQTAAPQQSAAVLILATRVEQLLTAYAIKRKTAKPRIRIHAVLQAQ